MREPSSARSPGAKPRRSRWEASACESAVFNLSVLDAGSVGKVTAYAANVTTAPVGTSIRFAAGETTETLVISSVDSTGSIKLLASSSVSVAVDLIGYLL